MVNESINIKRLSSVQPSTLTLNNDDAITEPQIIAEEFNSFFVNPGKEIAASIQPSNSKSTECM